MFTFTPLEAILLGGAISLVIGLTVKLFLSNKYVLKSECKIQTAILKSLKADNKKIFAMLRGIISHMPNLTSAEREKLLNLELEKSD